VAAAAPTGAAAAMRVDWQHCGMVTLHSNFKKKKWQKCDPSPKLGKKVMFWCLLCMPISPLLKKSNKKIKPKSGFFRKYFWYANCQSSLSVNLTFQESGSPSELL